MQRLVQTLESLEKQTLPPREFTVLVVDDGSWPPLAESPALSDCSFRFDWEILRQENQGPGQARTFGASRAGTEWIALLDSDVIAHPDWLRAGLERIEAETKGEDSSASGGGRLGALEGRTKVDPWQDRSPFTHQTENLEGGRYPTCNFFIRRELCDFYTGYQGSGSFREDSDLAFTLLATGWRIEFEGRALAFHPPLPARWNTPWRLTRRYRFDGLLKRRFPALFQSDLDFHVLLGRRISHLRGKIYAFTLACQSLAVAWFITGRPQPPLVPTWAAVAVLFFGGYLPSFYLYARLFTRKTLRPGIFLRCFLVVLPVPWIYAFSRLEGWWRFRRARPFSPPKN